MITYHYSIYDNGMVHLLINLPSKSWCVDMKNDFCFYIYDGYLLAVNNVLEEDETPMTSLILDEHIDFLQAVKDTIAYDMIDKDQYHAIYIPLAMLEGKHKQSKVFEVQEEV